ncbi:outer membrane protein transport protein [Robiginitalea marina]|uniref:Outer membrane protein transport protein n=1 Tax=Robiginitalea marina TaxID=2954105 RepID=A0ABT1B075_9FLAO|nr:outer membrane protein transport protein [Robiginitalea marina]MCO5725695.1 outer membrane protein transport protein [Robiginitalea marina]
MVKKLIAAILCFATYGVSAQNGTVSPYSFFGIGDLKSVRTVDNQMMGGLGIYTDSIHIHLNNPASLGKLGLTAYSAAFSHKELRLETFTEEQNSSVSNLEYLAVALPIKSQQAAIGFGLKPFSSIGYSLVNETTDSQGSLVTSEFNGRGGLNQVYLSAGFRVLPDLHVGATVNYFFGNLETARLQLVEDVVFGTQDLRQSEVSGFDFNYGLTYTPSFGKHTLFTSLRVNTRGNLVSKNNQQIGSVVASTLRPIEVIEVDLDRLNLRNTEIKIPTTTSIGLGYGQDKRWFVGAEYSFQKYSDFVNTFLEQDNTEYEDASSYALGGFFIPDYNSFDSFFNRVVYRAGVRLDNTGLVVNDKPLENFGITFGLGLPISADFSNLNIGFELGRRGTTMNDLVRESYFKVSVGLAFNARWFLKRQIN